MSQASLNRGDFWSGCSLYRVGFVFAPGSPILGQSEDEIRQLREDLKTDGRFVLYERSAFVIKTDPRLVIEDVLASEVAWVSRQRPLK